MRLPMTSYPRDREPYQHALMGSLDLNGTNLKDNFKNIKFNLKDNLQICSLCIECLVSKQNAPANDQLSQGQRTLPARTNG